jgi:O-antigen/teichoic acid export membrane protein
MKLGEKLVSNSAYLFLDWFIVTLFSLLYWLSIGKTLPPKDYGIIATAINTVTILASFALIGLTAATPKLLAEYLDKKNFQKARALVAFSVKTTLIITIAISIILFFAAQQLATLFNVPLLSLQIAALLIVPMSLWSLSLGILNGYQNMRKIFSSNAIGFALKAFLAWLLVLFGFGFTGPLLAWFLSTTVIVLLRRKYLNLFAENHIDKKFVIFSYAIPAFVASIIWVFFANTPNIILSSLKGPAVTGLFAVALTITSPIAVVPNTLSLALFPIVSGLAAERNPKQRQSRLISLVTRYTFFVTLPLLIFFLVFSREFILFFAERSYLPAQQLFPYLAISAFLFGLGNIFASTIYAIRKPKISQYISLATTGIFLLLVFPLTIQLAAQGTAIAYLGASVSFLAASYFFIQRFLKIKWPTSSILKIIAASILFAGIAFFSTRFTLPIKILMALFSLVIYFFVLIPMRYYTYEDVRILQTLGKNAPVGRKIFHSLEKFLSKYV